MVESNASMQSITEREELGQTITTVMASFEPTIDES